MSIYLSPKYQCKFLYSLQRLEHVAYLMMTSIMTTSYGRRICANVSGCCLSAL